MKKILVSAAAVIAVSLPALAQNDESARHWIKLYPNRSPVTFTVTGTYSDGSTKSISERIIPVRSDKDSDQDGIPDEGYLRVTCREGRAIAAEFLTQRPELAAEGAGGSVGAQTIRGGWDMATLKKRSQSERLKASGPLAVAIDPGQSNLCAS